MEKNIDTQAKELLSGSPDDTLPVRDALPAMVRVAAFDTIAELLSRLQPAQNLLVRPSEFLGPETQLMFSEQVRGVLALVNEIERRCESKECEP